MEIKPTYVTFEQAKLLKEKGLDGIQIDYGLNQMLNHAKTPEQWQVCEWLRVNHGIWVSVAIFVKRDETVVWVYDIYKNNYIIEQFQRSKGFNSPQEAYSAAFDYILKEMV
jgi:hypothetical protein